MEFEILYHRAWVKQVDAVKTGTYWLVDWYFISIIISWFLLMLRQQGRKKHHANLICSCRHDFLVFWRAQLSICTVSCNHRWNGSRYLITFYAFISGLQATLLIRHPETREMLVNFDPLILQVIRESECMLKLGLEVPEAARVIYLGQENLKENCNALTVCIGSVHWWP